MFRNPSPEEMRSLLARAKTIAMIGLSPNPERPSHRIARRLIGWGYRIIPVRPAVHEVLGENAYAKLADVPGPIDLVNVFRAAREAPAIVEQCIARGVKAVWFQEGIAHDEAAARAREAGLTVVMDRCISVEYRRLMT